MANGSKQNDKHQRILNAAMKVFAQNGFYNSKVNEIAKEANVADGTIYLYFKNKDDILISLFEDKMSQIIEALHNRLEGVTDPLEKIRIYIRSHIDMARQMPDLAQVITLELRQSTRFMKEYDNQKFTLYLRILSDMIREGKDAGAIRKDVSPGIMKRALFGMLDEISLYIVLTQTHPKYDIDRIAEEMCEFFIRGLTAGDIG